VRTNVLLDVLLVLCLILSVCRKVVELKYGSMWGDGAPTLFKVRKV
jgi:hypothetical protein